MGMAFCIRGASPERLQELRRDADAADEFLFDEEAYRTGELVDLDKAWNVLHFMFTGVDAESDHPLSLLPNDPERIGTDNGYGGPWVFAPDRVAAFNVALEKLNDEELRARFDPSEMAQHDVYLAESLIDDGPEGLEYVLQSFPELRKLAERCAKAGWGMVGIIT